MGEPKPPIGAAFTRPSRAAISEALLADEGELVAALIEKAQVSAAERRDIARLAERLVQAARAGRSKIGWRQFLPA